MENEGSSPKKRKKYNSESDVKISETTISRIENRASSISDHFTNGAIDIVQHDAINEKKTAIFKAHNTSMKRKSISGNHCSRSKALSTDDEDVNGTASTDPPDNIASEQGVIKISSDVDYDNVPSTSASISCIEKNKHPNGPYRRRCGSKIYNQDIYDDDDEIIFHKVEVDKQKDLDQNIEENVSSNAIKNDEEANVHLHSDESEPDWDNAIKNDEEANVHLHSDESEPDWDTDSYSSRDRPARNFVGINLDSEEDSFNSEGDINYIRSFEEIQEEAELQENRVIIENGSSNEHDSIAPSDEGDTISAEYEYEDADYDMEEYYLSGIDSDSSRSDDYVVDIEASLEIKANAKEQLQEIMNKPKPNYDPSSVCDLMLREHGFNGLNSNLSKYINIEKHFKEQCYTSRATVESMGKLFELKKNSVCINCLNFNEKGDLLVSGGDDFKINIWKWATKEVVKSYHSGHASNVFQAKFLKNSTEVEIVSSSECGEVRYAIIRPSDATVEPVVLYKHKGSVHKIVSPPGDTRELISVGEDGCIYHMDLRTNKHRIMYCVNHRDGNPNDERKVKLFSISHHPLKPEICVAGDDPKVRVLDIRMMNNIVCTMTPSHLIQRPTLPITSATYNHDGTEILASYIDESIYLFNNVAYEPGSYLHQYTGHFNHRTIKSVNFFGPNSEYILTGSDCENLFIYCKETEAIMNCLSDKDVKIYQSVTNCIEPHPTIPIFATSGFYNVVKLWAPNREEGLIKLDKLKGIVLENLIGIKQNVNRQSNFFVRFRIVPESFDESDSGITDLEFLMD